MTVISVMPKELGKESQKIGGTSHSDNLAAKQKETKENNSVWETTEEALEKRGISLTTWPESGHCKRQFSAGSCPRLNLLLPSLLTCLMFKVKTAWLQEAFIFVICIKSVSKYLFPSKGHSTPPLRWRMLDFKNVEDDPYGLWVWGDSVWVLCSEKTLEGWGVQECALGHCGPARPHRWEYIWK